MLLTALLFLAAPLQQPETTLQLSETVHRLEALGVEVTDRRWLDPAAGTVRRETRLPGGRLVDLAALRQRNREQARREGAKLSPALRARLADAGPTQPVDVVFWLRCEDSPDFRAILRNAMAAGVDGEDARRLARDTAVEFFEGRIQEFAGRLEAAGHEVLLRGGAWPIVFARLSGNALTTWVEDEAVDYVYAPSSRWEPELDHAQATLRTSTVWDRGVTGSFSLAKVLVNDTGHVTQTNSDLPLVTWLNSGSTGSHGSGVAGNICFNHPTYRGAAYGLPTIYSAMGTGDIDAPVIWNDAISSGIALGNCSWWNFQKGAIEFLDRFFDYTLRNFAVMMFKSTGNQGNTSEPYSTTPGNAYNVTSSGSYNDGDDHDWVNDAMASYSSWWNPQEGHEKPEVASPGDGVTTAGTSTTQSFGGTSSASPLTCGVATLLASRDPSLLTSPERLKAILMVSAWHNVEGAALLSDKDGAGGVHAAAADAVLRDGQFDESVVTAGDFPGGNLEIPFTAYEGDETRVIALWFSKANGGLTTDLLEMDLDLVVLGPQGGVVASSASALNPFELTSFIPSETGVHTIRLVNQRFDGASETLAVAWSSRQDAAVGRVSLTGTPGLGQSITLTFENPYDASVSYRARASLATLPHVVPLGDGRVLPLRQDKAWQFSLGVSGFQGTLNAAGLASTSVVVPNKPGLVGRTLFVGFYTVNGNFILDTSEPLDFTVLP